MGWTAPATFSVAEVVTASKLNTHIRDNLDYLKGNAGAVAIAAGITAAGDLAASTAGGGTVLSEGTNNGSFARFRLLTKRTSAAVVDWRIMANAVSDAGEFVIVDQAVALERFRIDNAGNVGFGGTPAGKLHAFGAGGGMLYLSHNAVAGTLITLAPAATVTQLAIMWGMIRNNGGSTLAFIGLISANTFQLGTALIVNCNTAADQVTITVTAGGAITAQRTAGGNSHAINVAVLYQ